MYTIRKYREKDKDDVRKVCISLAGKEWQEKKLFREALLAVYCDYYIECEPEHCFVAVDEEDRVSGYVLCAPDYSRFKTEFPKKYLKTLNPVTQGMGRNAVASIADYAKDYPAHLHIDLLPETQGQGVGRRLIEALTEHLKEIGAGGLILDVAIDNTGAQAFYEKCGFTMINRGKQEILYGMSIPNDSRS